MTPFPVLKKYFSLFFHQLYVVITDKCSNLILGMKLEDIISAVTEVPSSVINKSDKENGVNTCKLTDMDLTVLKLQDCNENADDCAGNSQILTKKFVPKFVYRKLNLIKLDY